MEYKRNFQRIKPLETPYIDFSKESEHVPPDETTSPEPRDGSPQENELTEAVSTGTPRRSGRGSQPLRALNE